MKLHLLFQSLTASTLLFTQYSSCIAAPAPKWFGGSSSKQHEHHPSTFDHVEHSYGEASPPYSQHAPPVTLQKSGGGFMSSLGSFAGTAAAAGVGSAIGSMSATAIKNAFHHGEHGTSEGSSSESQNSQSAHSAHSDSSTTTTETFGSIDGGSGEGNSTASTAAALNGTETGNLTTTIASNQTHDTLN